MLKILKSNIVLLFTICSFIYSYSQENKQKIDSLFDQSSLGFKKALSHDFDEALTILTSCLKESEKVKNDTLTASVQNNLGVLYSLLEDDEKSLYHYNIALEIHKKNKDSLNTGHVYNNIGIGYTDKKEYYLASEYYKKALQYAKNRKDSIMPLYNIGYNNFNYKDYNEAEKYLIKIDSIYKEHNQENKRLLHRIIHNAYYYLGIINQVKENHFKAELYYNKSIKLAKELKKPIKHIQKIHKKQYSFYKNLGKHNIAHAYIDSINITRDSIKELDKLKLYKEVEAKYQLEENKEKLALIEKKQKTQKRFNLTLLILASLLMLSTLLIYKKNKELKISKEKTDVLANAKTQFYSEISHEIRTPLYGVIELSKLLLRENPKEEHIDYLESLNFSGNHLLSLINNVLEYNKIGANKLAIQNVSFNLKKLLDNLIESSNFSLKQNKNILNFNFDENIPYQIYGDSLKLSQILINLVSNAIKFTNNGIIDLNVSQLEKSEEHVAIRFEVKDNGRGISKEKQELVYQDFYQDVTTTHKEHAGTGLGLSIVLKLLKALGSKIELTSEEGKGSSFKFNLKFKINTDIKSKIAESKNTLKGLKILLVDDNAINLMVSKKIIENSHGTCEAVTSGKDAINTLKSKTFDCILMDINMPELNGFETSDIIRKTNKKTPILLLSASSGEEIEKMMNKNVIDDYISKPFINSIFINKITLAIQNRESKQ